MPRTKRKRRTIKRCKFSGDKRSMHRHCIHRASQRTSKSIGKIRKMMKQGLGVKVMKHMDKPYRQWYRFTFDDGETCYGLYDNRKHMFATIYNEDMWKNMLSQKGILTENQRRNISLYFETLRKIPGCVARAFSLSKSKSWMAFFMEDEIYYALYSKKDKVSLMVANSIMRDAMVKQGEICNKVFPKKPHFYVARFFPTAYISLYHEMVMNKKNTGINR